MPTLSDIMKQDSALEPDSKKIEFFTTEVFTKYL